MIKYLSLDYVIKTVIPIIHEQYVRKNNPAHYYLGESEAMANVSGCLERVQWDYVQGVIPKAAQLFICINKGHFFKNGNKRLALVTLLGFLLENGFGFRQLNKDEYKRLIKELFSDFGNFEDELDFSAEEFAFYNLTIIVADSGKFGFTHDKLKSKVEEFLRRATIPDK